MNVAAPPVKGRANQEIVRWLSKRLQLSSSKVRLVSGRFSNLKVIEIIGVTEDEINRALGTKVRKQ